MTTCLSSPVNVPAAVVVDRTLNQLECTVRQFARMVRSAGRLAQKTPESPGAWEAVEARLDLLERVVEITAKYCQGKLVSEKPSSPSEQPGPDTPAETVEAPMEVDAPLAVPPPSAIAKPVNSMPAGAQVHKGFRLVPAPGEQAKAPYGHGASCECFPCKGYELKGVIANPDLVKPEYMSEIAAGAGTSKQIK